MSRQTMERLWEQFIEHVRNKGVTEHVARWYVRRAEQYLGAYPDQPLAHHAAQRVEQYLREMDRKRPLESWQFRQVIEAIQIQFVDCVRVEWAGDFDWEYWLASTRELEANHPTVTRSHDALPRPSDQQPSASTQEQVRQRYAEVMRGPHLWGTPETPPYFILRCMSRPRFAALRLSASCSSGLPRRARGAAITAGERWWPAEACGRGTGAKKWLCISFPPACCGTHRSTRPEKHGLHTRRVMMTSSNIQLVYI